MPENRANALEPSCLGFPDEGGLSGCYLHLRALFSLMCLIQLLLEAFRLGW